MGFEVGVPPQGYADGSANTIRRTSCTYPDGRVVNCGYTGTAADRLSRVDLVEIGTTDIVRKNEGKTGQNDFLDKRMGIR